MLLVTRNGKPGEIISSEELATQLKTCTWNPVARRNRYMENYDIIEVKEIPDSVWEFFSKDMLEDMFISLHDVGSHYGYEWFVVRVTDKPDPYYQVCFYLDEGADMMKAFECLSPHLQQGLEQWEGRWLCICLDEVPMDMVLLRKAIKYSCHTIRFNWDLVNR